MKVVYLSMSPIPSRAANSINSMKSCAALAELGHEVTLIAPALNTPEIDRTVADPFAYYGVHRSFTLMQLPCPYLPGGRTLYSWLAVRYTLRLLPDLVIGRYLRPTSAVCRRGIPTILDIHSGVKSRKNQNFRHLCKTLRYPALRAVMTLTGAMRRHYLDLNLPGLSPERILVSPSGGDPIDPAPVPKNLPRRTKGLQIGFAGKFEEAKGIGLIGELAKRLPHHDFHLFGGTGDELEFWQKRLAGPNVHFHGFIAPAELPAWLAALDVCLLPNLENAKNPDGRLYSSPLKLFDYMALKKTIIASAHEEIIEVLDDSCSILLDPEEPEAWARAIDGLSESDLERLGENAGRKFREEFTRTAKFRTILCRVEPQDRR